MVPACRVGQINYYARSHDPMYHGHIERHLSILIFTKFDKVNGA